MVEDCPRKRRVEKLILKVTSVTSVGEKMARIGEPRRKSLGKETPLKEGRKWHQGEKKLSSILPFAALFRAKLPRGCYLCFLACSGVQICSKLLLL